MLKSWIAQWGNLRALRKAGHRRRAGRLQVRQGDWPAIFTIDGGDVVVIRIAHRSEVCD